MPEVIHLGPFMMKSSWLIVAFGMIAGYLMIKGKLRETPYEHTKILDSLSTGLFIVIIAWKMGPLFQNPILLWSDPSNILYISGRTEHFWVGVVIALGYLWWKMKKNDVPIMVLFDVLPIGILSLYFLYYLFIPEYGVATTLPWGVSINDPSYTYHPIHVYQLIITIPLLLWNMNKKVLLGTGIYFSRTLLWFGMGQLVISFFTYQSPVFAGLSYEQLFYLSSYVFGSLLNWKKSKIAESSK